MEVIAPKGKLAEPEFNGVRVASFHGRAKSDEQPKHLTCFEFSQRVISLEGGQQRLRLLKPLYLQIDHSLKFTVKDWGLQMDCAQLTELPREIARRFLFLLSAAERENLTENDQADWLRISDYVNFRQFSIDRSPPRYQEGMLVSNKEKWIVEWHDGTRETLRREAFRALADVNPGERFSAYVKLGNNDETVAIERVSLLGPASLSKEDWSDWPPKG